MLQINLAIASSRISGSATISTSFERFIIFIHNCSDALNLAIELAPRNKERLGPVAEDSYRADAWRLAVALLLWLILVVYCVTTPTCCYPQ